MARKSMVGALEFNMAEITSPKPVSSPTLPPIPRLLIAYFHNEYFFSRAIFFLAILWAEIVAPFPLDVALIVMDGVARREETPTWRFFYFLDF